MTVTAAVALAIAFGPAEEKGGMSLGYAGILVSDSNQVVFTITNTSRVTLAWYIHLELMDENTSAGRKLIEMPAQADVKGLSETTFNVPVRFGKRWRVAVWYDRPISDSFFSRWRGRCIHFADDRGWYRLEEWLQPNPKMLWAYGPEMLGDKPAAAPIPP